MMVGSLGRRRSTTVARWAGAAWNTENTVCSKLGPAFTMDFDSEGRGLSRTANAHATVSGERRPLIGRRK